MKSLPNTMEQDEIRSNRLSCNPRLGLLTDVGRKRQVDEDSILAVEAISGFESLEGMDEEETGYLGSRIMKVIDSDFEIFPLEQRMQGTVSLKKKSVQLKPMDSVGGNVSASRDKEGNSEITVEGHITSRSNDGKTSVSGRGEVSVSQQGNVSGEVRVGIEHEF